MRVFGTLTVAGLIATVAALPALAARPPLDGEMDYEKVVEVGLRSSDSTTVAPFNVSSSRFGFPPLNFIEIRSENELPFCVTVYSQENYPDRPSWTTDVTEALVSAGFVTYFLITFAPLTVETIPAENHTDAAEVAARFENLTTAPRDGDYWFVIERKELESSVIRFSQDRISGPGLVGVAVMGVFIAAAVAIVIALVIRERRRGPPLSRKITAPERPREPPQGSV